MANITTSVPNLIQGVSQQSPQVRLNGQCEDMLNSLPTLTKGLTKRPPAQLIDVLSANSFEGDFLHFINRSETERYVVTIENRTSDLLTGDKRRGIIRVFNLTTGEEATVDGELGGVEYPSDYLTLADGAKTSEKLKAVTVGDSTFILNTDVIVDKLDTKSEALDSSRALVFIKQGDYGKKYALRFRTQETLQGNGAEFEITWGVEIDPAWTKTVYQLYIESVTLVSGGSGYSLDDEPTIALPESVYWDERPEFNITVGDDQTVQSVDLLHKGISRALSTDEYTSLGYTTGVVTRVGATTPYDEAYVYSKDTASDGKNADTSRITEGFVKVLRGEGVVSNTLVDNHADLSYPTAENAVLQNEYTFKDKGGAILINRIDGGNFYLESHDGLANKGMGIVHKEVGSISDLPESAPDGFRIAVRGDGSANEDDYYLRFHTNDGQSYGEGGWAETVGPDIDIRFDPDTLPLQLVSEDVNAFTLNTTGWTDRDSGDDNTNPFPSFLGRTLNNFVFFKNRLGFLYEDSVVLSEAGELFNFFRTTVRTLLDTAPIDVTSATPNVTTLRSSVAFQENLLLFGNRGQFVLKGDPLTNETISLDAVTNYDVNTSAEPIPLGSYVYFPFNRGSALGVHEYSLNATTDVYDSAEITTQIPNYIPQGNILSTSGSSTVNLMAIASGGPDIYIYKYFFNGQEKVLSSWGKFTVPFDVVSLEFMEHTLFVIGNRGNQTLLTELKCEELRVDKDTEGGFILHLDLLKKHTFAGDPSTSPTPVDIDLGFKPTADDVLEIYDDLGRRVRVTRVSGSTATIESFNRTCFSGLQYNQEYTFSEPVFKQGNPAVTSGLGRLVLRNGTLFFTDAVDFQVEVTPIARDTRVFPYSPNVINVTSTDTLLAQDGKLRFSIFTEAKDSVIKIVNSSAFAANFQSCEFEANVHTRATRI